MAALTVANIDQMPGELRFRRPKVKGTEREEAQHELTPHTRELASYYVERLYLLDPTAARPTTTATPAPPTWPAWPGLAGQRPDGHALHHGHGHQEALKEVAAGMRFGFHLLFC
jgi:hypothetical protein